MCADLLYPEMVCLYSLPGGSAVVKKDTLLPGYHISIPASHAFIYTQNILSGQSCSHWFQWSYHWFPWLKVASSVGQLFTTANNACLK